jgi:hypothetical protein
MLPRDGGMRFANESPPMGWFLFALGEDGLGALCRRVATTLQRVVRSTSGCVLLLVFVLAKGAATAPQ